MHYTIAIIVILNLLHINFNNAYKVERDTTRSETPLKLVVMDQTTADYYGAKCLDGTPPYRYQLIRDAKKWVFFVEGGGYCTSVSDCASRAMGGLGSSKGAASTAVVGGILSTDIVINPRFSNYSLVFLKYCDGSSHTSYQKDPIPVPSEVRSAGNAPTQIWMRGRAILVAQFKDLLTAGLKDADEIILSGGSAGATTVYAALDFVRDMLRSDAPAAKFVGAPDAGFFLDVPNANGRRVLREQFISVDKLWNYTATQSLNADCRSAFPNQPWMCFVAPYGAPFIETPFFISNSAYDAVEFESIFNLGCTPNAPAAGYPKCNETQMATFELYRQKKIDALETTLASHPYTGLALLSCFVHEINVDYCSGQAIPNCKGWNAYKVTAPGYPPHISTNDIFTMWYDDVISNWEYVTEQRRLAHVVLKNSLKRLPHGKGAKVIQVIDPLSFPQNPTCPYP